MFRPLYSPACVKILSLYLVTLEVQAKLFIQSTIEYVAFQQKQTQVLNFPEMQKKQIYFN